MYLPKHFEINDTQALHTLIRQHPLATLVIQSADGLDANHIPLLLRQDGSAHGCLAGHVARANPLWRQAQQGIDCLAIFHGAEDYVSPNWYASKAETGKVVPTWNYSVVHVHGTLRAIDDADWLRGLLDELTQTHEARQPAPWQTGDAPADYLEKLMQAIVGIQIDITQVTGKAKLSQNQPLVNQRSIAAGLQSVHSAVGELMAAKL